MMSPIPVAHIITKLELGGAQQNTLFTVGHLDRKRFSPVLITGATGFLDAEAQSLAGVEFYQIPSLQRPIRPFADVRSVVTLTRLLRRIKPVIVHTHSSKAGIVGRCAARFARVPIVVHSIHGFGFTPGHHPLLRRLLVTLERHMGRVTTRVFAVSEANRRLGIALGIFPADRCAIIRSGVDLDVIRRTTVDVMAKKRALGLAPSRPTVGMVAALKPQKAPLDFVRMAAIIHRQKPDVQFVLVGDGELRQAVEAEILRHGLSSACVMLGWRRDIAEIMRCFDVFALTSRWEGLPRVYLEALASGVPVVGTRVDGTPEIIRDGFNGYLVEPGDVQGLADRITFLLDHPAASSRMARDAGTIAPEFDIYEMVRRQEREYERLLAEWQQNTPGRDRRKARAVGAEV